MKEARAAALTELLASGKKSKIPTSLMEKFCHFLFVESEASKGLTKDTNSTPITAAITQQVQIGSHVLQQGYLVAKRKDTI